MRRQNPLLFYFFLMTITLSLLFSLTLFQMSRAGFIHHPLRKITDVSEPIPAAPAPLPVPVPPPAVTQPEANPPERLLEIVDAPKPVADDQTEVVEEKPPPATQNREQPSSQVEPGPEVREVIQVRDVAADESDCLDILEDKISSREFEIVIWKPLSPGEKAEQLQKQKKEDELKGWFDQYDMEIITASPGKRLRLQKKFDEIVNRLRNEVLTKSPEKILRHRVKTENGRIVAEALIWVEFLDPGSDLAEKCRRGEIEPEDLLGHRVFRSVGVSSPELKARLLKLQRQHGNLTYEMQVEAIGFDPVLNHPASHHPVSNAPVPITSHLP